jgi:hypothetical protein
MTRCNLGQLIQIDIFPDDVLLDIFDFCRSMDLQIKDLRAKTDAWQSLVHVCRRWRCLVFASPRRLNLQLFCTPDTSPWNTLDVWPALPLIIDGRMGSLSSIDNVIPALVQRNRVCQVSLWNLEGWQFEQVFEVMQVPFPELTHLRLSSHDKTPRSIPDSFLDGSAPRLRSFSLNCISFPGLPRLHLYAPHLVLLDLHNIPHSGYISPEAIVDILSVLSSLKSLFLGFRSPQSRPDWEFRRPPPPKRSVILALVVLQFQGVTEYLEDLMTFIDTPQLDAMYITFFNQIDFDIPRLAQFINRTFKFAKPDARAHVEFNNYGVYLKLELESGTFQIGIPCEEPDWQLSSIEQVCNSFLHPLSMAEDLYIDYGYYQLVWKDNLIENTLWLQLLLPFTAVKNLYLSKHFSLGIAAALKELTGSRITEVLPSLQNIFAEHHRLGHFQENIGQFVTARQFSDHPITVSHWTDWNKYAYR